MVECHRKKIMWRSDMSVIDIELTLNRFGFGKIADNKFQLAILRVSWWNIPDKRSISFEINWKVKGQT